MKIIAAVLASASVSIAAGAAELSVKLTGLARVGERDVVLLETQHPGGGILRPILEVGDRMDGIEVVSIDSKAATASLKQGATVTEFALGTGGDSGKAPMVNCKDADARQVLELYQRLSGCTVIASSSLPAARITVKSDADPAGAVAQALADQDIVVTKRFSKFAFATRFSDTRLLEQLKVPPEPATDLKSEKFPAGLIKFHEADRSQVLDIYQEVVGRTVIMSPRLPSAKITVKSETQLTRGEAVWLLEAALHLSGIHATTSYEKFAFATAPQDAPRLARIKPPPRPPNDSKVERFPPGLIKFSQAELTQVLDIYQDLAGLTVQRQAALPSPQFTFRSQTELTRDEAVWLLESALQLGGVRFVPDGDKQVKVLPETNLNAANN